MLLTYAIDDLSCINIDVVVLMPDNAYGTVAGDNRIYVKKYRNEFESLAYLLNNATSLAFIFC